MSNMKLDSMKVLGSLLFLGLFVYLWGDLLLEFKDFKPQPKATPPVPTMPVDDFRAGVLGTLVTTLAAAVGAMYGVKVASATFTKVAAQGGGVLHRIWIGVKNALKALGAGIADVRFIGYVSTAIYLVFGITVLVVTLKRSSEAPDVMVTFAGSALAFVGALFTASTTQVE